MKFIHLSDLHIGKRLCEYSLIDDQRYILNQILDIIKAENPGGIIIAGDVYDKSIPSEEAVELFDEFLYELSALPAETFIISGNHDSAERLSFAGRIIDASGIHISHVYDGEVKPYTLYDEFGPVNVYMLPFIKPVHVRRFFPDDEIQSYTDAVDVAIKNMPINKNERNVLVTHQFVTGAVRSESEDISVGGTDNVDARVFEKFDYVALGHIHNPQNMGSERIRYCGTPLKYSVSEAGYNKSVTSFELSDNGTLNLKTIPLIPLHNLAELKGTYLELTSKSFYDDTSYRTDYVHITLTDENDIIDASGKLGVIYKRLTGINYDNTRTRKNSIITLDDKMDFKSPLELFEEFYKLQNNAAMSEEQRGYMRELIEDVWEAEG